ncbi:MAG: CCA tRNA nucleotidyltransferase [Heliomarina sp.]|uniref:CCA tRNA nucleotidyltransferase n=1 Tax=Heliomarina sp. TaxID=2917556 RepID=UPI0040597150
MRLTADWLTRPATQAVCTALSMGGAKAYFVGGCVRNTIINADVSDIDIATDARPEKVIEFARSAGLKAIPTGIDHGTVTLVSGGIPHEVTTFRRDVKTDGRHAVVSFSNDIAEDAVRRDFTMNALYATPEGTLIDPMNGLPDLQDRRVRFIGDAISRIREDYLRSLRYFRFHAWYGDPGNGMDSDALAAIAQEVDGLGRISRERIGAELLKLLAAPDPAASVAAMRATGVLAQVLPGADDTALGPLIHCEDQANAAPDAIRRLSALGGNHAGDALRLSKVQSARLATLADNIGSTCDAAELGYRLGYDLAKDVMLLRSAVTGNAWASATDEQLKIGSRADFPVSAKDLMPEFSGPDLGRKLAELEGKWIASGFLATRSDLLAS